MPHPCCRSRLVCSAVIIVGGGSVSLCVPVGRCRVAGRIQVYQVYKIQIQILIMSKGNLFLGFGRGKVGDVVFSRQNGEQVTRARNRSPRNPRTPLMMLQRVCMKTTALAFSLMKDICDHSFQGYNGTTENQSRFVERNIALFRRQLADYINSGDPQAILNCQETNFSQKSSSLPPYNAYQISEGSLQPMGQFWYEDSGLWALSPIGNVIDDTTTISTLTYAELVEYLGCQQGDQLTLVWLYVDDLTVVSDNGVAGEFNAFRYARFICEPDDGDMTHPITDSTHLNPRNEGDIHFALVPYGGHSSYLVMNMGDGVGGAHSKNAVAASAVILSRQSGGVWQRSTETLSLRPYTVGGQNHLYNDQGVLYLADAIDSYMSDTASTMYLNQAE